MARTIEKGDKILDVRDITRLFSDMESERDDLVQAVEDAKEARDAFASDDSDDAGEIDAAETELADAEKELAEWDADNGEDFIVQISTVFPATPRLRGLIIRG